MSIKSRLPWWKNKELKNEEKNKLLEETFHRVFSTEDGKIVLNALLTDMKLFEPALTAREIALNEYAKYFIRERMGVRDTKAMTDFIASLSINETIASGGGK